MKDTNSGNIIYGLGISILIVLLIIPFIVWSNKAEVLYYQQEIPKNNIIKQEPEKEPEIKVGNKIYCSCIKTARAEGVDIPYNTNAEDFIANSVPQVGGLVLMEYGLISHVAVIVKFINEGIIIREGNKIHCEKTERLIPYSYYAIKGFWNPEK